MTEEKWKDIPGYEGLYQVSTLSRIRSLDVVKEYCCSNGRKKKRLHKGMVLKHWRGPGGFLTVTLYKDRIPEFKAVHRLVAVAFLENPKGYKSVSFRDKDRYNVKLENLRWGRKD